jgi:hypothetical protein
MAQLHASHLESKSPRIKLTLKAGMPITNTASDIMLRHLLDNQFRTIAVAANMNRVIVKIRLPHSSSRIAECIVSWLD